MARMLDNPMELPQRERSLALIGLVRADMLNIQAISNRGDHSLIDLNRRLTEEAAGNGWPFIRVTEHSLLPAHLMTQRLAQEMNHIILWNKQYTQKSDWM